MMETIEEIFAFGHKNVLATHKTTLEITKSVGLSKRGDCIIAVSADKAAVELKQEFRQSLRNKNAKIAITIDAGDVVETVKAFGSPHLILTHPMDFVIRKSNYICSRTLAIQADKAACDLSRKLVEKLKIPKQRVKITLAVEV